jgi:CRP-like cAMP-binding protein
MIRPGEIFGEMSYFCGGKDAILSSSKEDTEIVIICADLIEKELRLHPEIYRQFMNSMTRKFRILLLQLANTTFNEGFGQVADALLRLFFCSESNMRRRNSLGIYFTQQELANNVGCSRITVTRCLNKFLKEGIIAYDDKCITLIDMEKLKQYIDEIVELE